MLRKLLSWRPSTRKPQTTLTLTLTLRPNTQFPFLSRFLSQSLPEDPYDPPFSPTSKPPKPEKTQKSPKKDPTRTRPLKSDIPFDFRYSYSETNPSVEPIGFREPPKFSPFGPGRIDRPWTGTSAPANQEVDPERIAQERNRVLGDPLSEEEVAELVERYRHSDCSRQINLGNFLYLNKDGFGFFLFFFFWGVRFATRVYFGNVI